ncbi:MAG: hypothetical protein V1717_00495, partial [Candidatus Micrarchaeota archaeon]
MKVLIDTNVLLSLLDSKTDFARLLEEEYPEALLFVLKQSLAELKAKKAKAAGVVEAYLKSNGIALVGGEGKADDLILRWAAGEKAAVLTLDEGLKKRLKK